MIGYIAQKSTRENNILKKNIDYGFIILFYAILFLPKIGMVDLKSIILFLYFVFGITQSKVIKIDRKTINLLISLVALSLLFLINSISNEINVYILLRYLRVVFSIICLTTYLSSRTIDEATLVKSIIIVIMIHAIAIILSILVPSVRPFVYVISGYHRKELPLRSSGLLTGYDFAGCYLNISVVLSIFYNLKYKNKLFSIPTFIFIVAIVFTSRLNILILITIMICTVLFMLKTGRMKSIITIILVIPFLLVGSLFAILTFDIFSNIKASLVSNYSWISALNTSINYSYSSSQLATDIADQYYISRDINILIGNGIKARTDPGYVNAIYESGVVGLMIQIISFLSFLLYGYKNRGKNVITKMVAVIVLFIFVYNMKLTFFYASGITELLLVFYFISLKQEREIQQDGK